jgi:hypothetical protein
MRERLREFYEREKGKVAECHLLELGCVGVGDQPQQVENAKLRNIWSVLLQSACVCRIGRRI